MSETKTKKKNLSKSMEWINDEIKNDSTEPDINKLDIEVLQIPYQYGKWINVLAIEKAFYRKYTRKLKWLKLRKFDFYRGHPNDEYMDGKISNINCSTNAMASVRVESDEEVMDYEDKVALQEIKIEQITEFLKLINSKGWNIKHAIDYLKFKNAEH